MRHGLFGAALAAALLAGCRAPDRGQGENTEDKFYPATEADWEAVVACLRSDYGPPHHEPLRPGFEFWPTKERLAETNVQTKLLEVGAYLRGGKVYDASGKEMYFYHVPEWNVGWRRQNRMKDGEGGNEDRGERDKQPRDLNATIEELEKTCHVVRMYIGRAPAD